MSLVFGSARVETKYPVVSFVDDPKRVPRVRDGGPRNGPASILVLHKTSGRDGGLVQGALESVRDFLYARYQASTERDVSWHLTVDLDGSATQSADPILWTTWHCGHWNGWTDGWEFVAGPRNALTTVQCDAGVDLAIRWTRATGTQRWIPTTAGEPIPDLYPENGSGRWFTGIVGHRDLWARNRAGKLVCARGHGDPDDEPFDALERAGFRRVDFKRGEHRDLLRDAQRTAGLTGSGIDGKYGRDTRAAFARAFPHGMLVAMPGDE